MHSKYFDIIAIKHNIKKLISILVICIIILNSLLFGIIYIAIKGELKKDFLSSLSYKIHTIPFTVVTSDEIETDRSIEMLDNDELKIGNVFYDIFKTELIDGKTTYYCFSDKNEEYLEKTLTNFLTSVLQHQNSRSLNIVKLIKFPGFPVKNINIDIVPQYITSKPFTIYSFVEVVQRVPTPPPELVNS